MKKKGIYAVTAAILCGAAAYGAINSGFPYASVQWPGFGPKRNIVQWAIRALTDGASSDLVPGTDNTNSIGSSTNRVKDIRTVTETVSGTKTVGGTSVFTPGSAQSLAVGTTISPTSTVVPISGAGGNVTLTSTPNITTSGVTTGTYLILISTGNIVTLQDQTSLASSGLSLSAATVQVTTVTARSFIYNGTVWKQLN